MNRSGALAESQSRALQVADPPPTESGVTMLKFLTYNMSPGAGGASDLALCMDREGRNMCIVGTAQLLQTEMPDLVTLQHEALDGVHPWAALLTSLAPGVRALYDAESVEIGTGSVCTLYKKQKFAPTSVSKGDLLRRAGGPGTDQGWSDNSRGDTGKPYLFIEFTDNFVSLNVLCPGPDQLKSGADNILEDIRYYLLTRFPPFPNETKFVLSGDFGDDLDATALYKSNWGPDTVENFETKRKPFFMQATSRPTCCYTSTSTTTVSKRTDHIFNTIMLPQRYEVVDIWASERTPHKPVVAVVPLDNVFQRHRFPRFHTTSASVTRHIMLNGDSVRTLAVTALVKLDAANPYVAAGTLMERYTVFGLLNPSSLDLAQNLLGEGTHELYDVRLLLQHTYVIEQRAWTSPTVSRIWCPWQLGDVCNKMLNNGTVCVAYFNAPPVTMEKYRVRTLKLEATTSPPELFAELGGGMRGLQNPALAFPAEFDNRLASFPFTIWNIVRRPGGILSQVVSMVSSGTLNLQKTPVWILQAFCACRMNKTSLSTLLLADAGLDADEGLLPYDRLRVFERHEVFVDYTRFAPALQKTLENIFNQFQRTAGRVDIVDSISSPTPQPPFPSTDIIPPSFLFLVHMSTSDPRTWTDRTLNRSAKHNFDTVSKNLTPLEYTQFPGVYMTLVTTANLDTVQFYPGAYMLIFSLDLLRQRNWHCNVQDMSGWLGEAVTFFPHQQAIIENQIRIQSTRGVSKTGRSFNEVVIHDSVPLDPFLCHVIVGSTEVHTREMRKIGRQLLNVDASRLNPALPLVCFPAVFAGLEVYHKELLYFPQHIYYPISSVDWKMRQLSACNVDWDATNAQVDAALPRVFDGLLDFFPFLRVNPAKLNNLRELLLQAALTRRAKELDTERSRQNFSALLSYPSTGWRHPAGKRTTLMKFTRLHSSNSPKEAVLTRMNDDPQSKRTRYTGTGSLLSGLNGGYAHPRSLGYFGLMSIN